MNISKELSLENLKKEELKELGYQKLMELYESLPSADFEEMDGDYDSCMVGFISEKKEKQSIWWLHKTEKGNWLGKSFTPTSTVEARGDGYNRWVIACKEVHHMRFLTDMSESLIDGKLTFRLKYASYKNDGGIVDMTDEVRRIRKGLYLCVGMADPEKLPPAFFYLAGPVHEYDHSSVWIYGDEVEKHANISVTYKNFPYPEDLK
ncbi:MAG: hypothetical protein ACW96X_02320 [Promethearchaeota archaeon]|jgi:hypothetical protein